MLLFVWFLTSRAVPVRAFSFPRDLQLHAFCDSDWAACPLSRRSLAAYVTFLGRSPLYWFSNKEPTVSRPSAEAE